MNKKDCELIGFILANAYEYDSVNNLINRLIKIDPRIEQKFLAFSENRLHNEKINELRDKKLTEKFGEDSVLKKRVLLMIIRKRMRKLKKNCRVRQRSE